MVRRAAPGAVGCRHRADRTRWGGSGAVIELTPAHRYAEIATDVRAICERYGLPYNTGAAPRSVADAPDWRFRDPPRRLPTTRNASHGRETCAKA